jgi:hypothetical protein
VLEQTGLLLNTISCNYPIIEHCTKEVVMRPFVTWVTCITLLGSAGASNAEQVELSCELDVGHTLNISLDLEARTLKNPLSQTVGITEQNRSWLVAQSSNSFAATSENRSGDFARTDTWVINRLTGELRASFFIGSIGDVTPTWRTLTGICRHPI